MPKDVHPDELIRVLETGKHGSWGYRAAETVRMLKWAAEQWPESGPLLTFAREVAIGAYRLSELRARAQAAIDASVWPRAEALEVLAEANRRAERAEAELAALRKRIAVIYAELDAD